MRKLSIVVAFLVGCSTDTAQQAIVLSPDLSQAPGADLAQPGTVDLAGVDFAGVDFTAVDLDPRPNQDLAGAHDLGSADLSVDTFLDMAMVLPSDMAGVHDLRPAFTEDMTSCSLPTLCFSSLECNGYFPCPVGYDPCRPQFCTGLSECAALPVLPDNTPCDDLRRCSFSYPASGGCPSNKCVGGSNNGGACTSDGQCPGGGTCFMNRCLGGPSAGSNCSSNQDCTGGVVNATCAKNPEGTLCNGGSEFGHHCQLLCNGGDFAGLPCTVDSDCFGTVNGTCPDVAAAKDCPAVGRCTRWTADPATKTCTATSDNPHCSSIADCPTTKYCAADPENRRGGYDSCYDSNDVCCTGGTSAGPCLIWDSCDTVNHLCVRTTQGNVTTVCGAKTVLKYGPDPCAGGLHGAGGQDGGVCNNICIGGICTSTANSCPP